MPADHSTPQPSSNLPKTDLVVPDAVIEEFLGLGLAYSEWPAEVQKRDHVWYPGLENIIIEKEWEFFKPEIQRLRLEPKIAQSSRSKSNSLASILKRLKGEPWLEGRPDEREERLRTHRLLGKDAKIRCLQKYVHDWDQAALSASQVSVQNATTKPDSESAPSQPTVSDNPAFESGSICHPLETPYSHDTPEPEATLIPGNVDINTDSLHSIYDCPSQFASPMAPLSAHPDPFSATTGDFNLLPAFQNAVPPPAVETSGGYLEPEISETVLKSPPAFSHDTTMSLFDHFAIGEDDVPTSADYSQGIGIPESEPNVFKWMETHQVSENFEPAETEAPRPDAAFQGTFFNPHNSFDMNDYLDFEGPEALEAGSTTEGMSADLAGQHNPHPGCPEIFSQPIWSPRSSSKGLKRRRQNTSGASLNMLGYGNTTTTATSYVASDGDTIMSGYESSSQHPNEPVSQGSRTQLAPPSGSLPTTLCSGMTSQPAYTEIRTQIQLALELQRTREELNSVRKLHQKLESFARKQQASFARNQQAAEAEISELREKMREMKESTEDYEKLARGVISQNIILQEEISRLQEANPRKKSVSGIPPTATKEREHSSKPVQSFPPSKNPRPLSLTLRPATANKGSSTPPRKLSASTLQDTTSNVSSSPPRKLSAATLQDTSTLRLPIATSSSSRLGSSDNSQISSENLVLAHTAHKSTGRRNRPDSADSNQVSSGQPVLTSSPSKHTGRNNWMQKFSNPFLRKQCRDDSSRPVQTAPTLPALEASVPLDRQMARVLVDGDKRLTNDSGYDSLRFETSSRASMADAE